MPAAYDPANIFAKILRGELPCHKLYEDEATFAFMDIMPRGDGHCLVIPKQAARNILDVDAESLAAVAATTQRLARAVPLRVCLGFPDSQGSRVMGWGARSLQRKPPHRLRFRFGAAPFRETMCAAQMDLRATLGSDATMGIQVAAAARRAAAQFTRMGLSVSRTALSSATLR